MNKRIRISNKRKTASFCFLFKIKTKVLSKFMTEVILVNEKDEAIGQMEKIQAMKKENYIVHFPFF